MSPSVLHWNAGQYSCSCVVFLNCALYLWTPNYSCYLINQNQETWQLLKSFKLASFFTKFETNLKAKLVKKCLSFLSFRLVRYAVKYSAMERLSTTFVPVEVGSVMHVQPIRNPYQNEAGVRSQWECVTAVLEKRQLWRLSLNPDET